MPTVSAPNLVLRRKTWFARLQVPDNLRAAIGRSVFIQTTGEHDLLKASRRAEPILAAWRAQIEDARTERRRRAIESIQRMHVPQVVKQSLMDSRGLSTAFIDHVDSFRAALAAQGMTPRQVFQYAQDILRFGDSPTPLRTEQITPSFTQAWCEGRLKAGDSLKTVKRRLSALRSYWAFLQDTKEVSRDAVQPFIFSVPKSATKGQHQRSKREAFTVEEIIQLHTAAGHETPMADLILLAAHTGGRINELCALTPALLKDGALHLNSKTDAGNRWVPLVGAPLLTMLDRRCKDLQPNDFIIPQETTNKYGERSQALSKRFGRLKASLGFDQSLVFHSIRKTFATLLHDAGCPEPIAADILGHKISSMSYGVYSAGSNMATRREWIERATKGFRWPTAQQRVSPVKHAFSK